MIVDNSTKQMNLFLDGHTQEYTQKGLEGYTLHVREGLIPSITGRDGMSTIKQEDPVVTDAHDKHHPEE